MTDDPLRAVNIDSIDAAAEAGRRVLDAVGRAVVGKRDQLQLVLSGFLSHGHVLLEDLPGLGKTLMAQSFGRVIGLSVGRVQFTPDLMPADVTGSMLFDQRERRFEFHPGPIFRNIVVGDEINRAPPKTQAALLEAMQERQVTVDGVSHPLPAPFVVLATQNPIEFEGTYPLPEAQVDRFMLRTSLGYPTSEESAEIIRRRLDRGTDAIELTPVLASDALIAMQTMTERVDVEDSVIAYAVALVEATRTAAEVEAGASPRGVDALIKLARARALLSARPFVLPDDVKAVAGPALAHRLVLRPELWVRGVRADEVVAGLVASVPTPATTRTSSPPVAP